MTFPGLLFLQNLLDAMFPKFDDLFKQSFEQWEKQTAQQWSQMLHDPAFLKQAWSAMEMGLQARQQWNKANEQLLTAWQLPTRNNQEGIQHQLNRLQMSLDELNERADALLEALATEGFAKRQS